MTGGIYGHRIGMHRIWLPKKKPRANIELFKFFAERIAPEQIFVGEVWLSTDQWCVILMYSIGLYSLKVRIKLKTPVWAPSVFSLLPEL